MFENKLLFTTEWLCDRTNCQFAAKFVLNEPEDIQHRHHLDVINECFAFQFGFVAKLVTEIFKTMYFGYTTINYLKYIYWDHIRFNHNSRY